MEISDGVQAWAYKAPVLRLPIYGESEIDVAVRCVIDQSGYIERLCETRFEALVFFIDEHSGIDTIAEVDQWIKCFAHTGCDDGDCVSRLEYMQEDHDDGRRKALKFFVSRYLHRAVGEADIGHVCNSRAVKPMPAPSTPGVYAIEGVGGYVKIGKAKNIESRMRDLQVAHPVPLKLLAVLSADPKDEGAFHRQWADLRCTGEWFKPNLEFFEFIAGVRRRP